ncbi:hypothetical protein JJV70_15700 [Streptomyces sp. JJ66]|uniref:hypothetical protein n=1 Tax=Streptomyces sp. JJ66 TaxID=2803843 RepID=UPI001C588BAF|nr:hypothetical protein [Streptomyces sp. JJ66]MBW1603522.1 hypothetical protein [Streptomyces sp. JJ66]
MSRTKLNRAAMWAAGGTAIAVLALTGYAVFDGGDGSAAPPDEAGGSPSAGPSPGPSYSTPQEWTEPERWAVLPRGKETDGNGNEVGFPRSTEGAVAMLASVNTTVVEGDRTLVEEQLGIYDSYLSAARRSEDYAERIELQAREREKDLRRRMGADVDGPLPQGAYLRSYVVGFQVVEESPGEVSGWLLGRTVARGNERAQESTTYTRTLMAAVWEGGDWKLSLDGTARAAQQAKGEEPGIAAPGDAAFNEAGWTALREAS